MSGMVVGRERELEASAALLSGLGGGAAGLVIEGEPGIGKTTVWTEAVERARSSCLVLAARPAEAEAGLAFAALADLLEPVVDDVLAELSEPQRHAIAVVLLREEPGDHRLDRRAVGAAALSVVVALAARRPVLVAIDDLQWLDGPSARTLEFVLRRIGDHPVGVLACQRSGVAAPVALDLARALGRRCASVGLEPLSLAALQRVLKDRLGRAFPRRVLARIERVAAGNPFFALELARSLPEEVSTLAALPLPETLRGLVDERIAGLSKRSQELLLVTAALASPSAEHVLSATRGGRDVVVRALERVVEAGVIGVDGSRVRFTHPLFAEGVYGAASAHDRRAVHRRLAGLVESIEERGRHLALAAEGGGPDELVAGVLEAAAEHARRRGAPDVAAELAEHGRRLTPSDDGQALTRRCVQEAEYHFHAGEPRRARELLERVLAAPSSGRARAHALRLLGDVRFHEDSVADAVPVFAEALEYVGDDLELATEVHLRLSYTSNSVGDFAAGSLDAGRALALAEVADEPGLLAEALAVAVVMGVLTGRGVDESRMQRALELEDPQREVPVEFRPSLIAGFVAMATGELHRVERTLGPLAARLRDRGQESDLAQLSSWRTWAACWAGRLDTAVAYAEEGLACAERAQSEPDRCYTLAFCALASAYAGDEQLARDRANECLALAPHTRFAISVLWASWGLAVLALSLEDPQAAHAALGPLASPFEEEGVPDPVRAFFIPDEVEALVALGDLDRAERLLAAFEASARRSRRPWALMMSARCRALLLAAAGEFDAASDAAAEALALCDGLELRIEVARTLLVVGQLERRRRQKGTAAALLRDALAIFEQAGAVLWAQRAQSELRRVGLRPAAPDELTDSERRVAELTASGLKNREVAAQLFMSPKTVEATLARVYRKLGIRSRVQLAVSLAATAQQPPQM
jgi:DNA-binding CsgD family transcriptional regulator